MAGSQGMQRGRRGCGGSGLALACPSPPMCTDTTTAGGLKRAFIAVGRTLSVSNSCQCQLPATTQNDRKEGDGVGDLHDGGGGREHPGPLLPTRVPHQVGELLCHWGFRRGLQG